MALKIDTHREASVLRYEYIESVQHKQEIAIFQMLLNYKSVCLNKNKEKQKR